MTDDCFTMWSHYVNMHSVHSMSTIIVKVELVCIFISEIVLNGRTKEIQSFEINFDNQFFIQPT